MGSAGPAPRVIPSVLAADFDRLGAQVQEVLDAGARAIHVDVMDGHFVPPITMGPLVVGALRERASEAGAMLEVHLMIEHPERQLAEFAAAGADVIVIHAESTPHIDYALSHIRAMGLSAGLAVNPSTPLALYAEVAEKVDLALCMTVNPGWGGQQFIERSIDRLAPLARCWARAPRSRSTAASSSTPAGAAARRGRRASSPARRSSGRRTPPPPTARSPTRSATRAGRARRARARAGPRRRRIRSRSAAPGRRPRRRASTRRTRPRPRASSAAAARRLPARQRGLVERARGEVEPHADRDRPRARRG